MTKHILFSIGFLICQLTVAQDNYDLLFVKGDFDRILHKSKDLNHPNDFYWSSLVLDKYGETLKAIDILYEGIGNYPDNQMIEKLLIECLYKTGQYSKVKPMLFKYIDNPDMLIKLVNVLAFEGEYLEAVNYLNEKIKTDSLNVEYLSQLGEFYNQIDSLRAAINIFERLVKLNSNDIKNANRLANLYIRNKDYDKAIIICDLVLQNDTVNKKFMRIKGIAAFTKADFDLAARCFNTLFEQGDSGKFVLKHLGISEFRNSFFKESREHLLMAYRLDSNDFETCYFLGKAFLNSPTPAGGLFYFNRVDSLLQPNPVVLSTLYYDKQSIYSAIGKHHEALKCYEMAFNFNPKPEYLFYIASLYQNKLENKNKAIEFYEKFLAQLPPKPDSEHIYDEKQIIISLRKAAETNIISLKEELFFKGELNKN